MKKLILKGLVALVAGVGAMITGWGIGSLFDVIDETLDAEKNPVNHDENV